MLLFKRGSQFLYAGRRETVDYVMVRSTGLLVYLVGKAEPVNGEKLSALPAGLPSGFATPPLPPQDQTRRLSVPA